MKKEEMDFTLSTYKQYLNLIKKNFNEILTFREFLLNSKKESFCLIRHDVDRMPYHALQMGRLEATLGIHSTYYFRMKKCSFNPDVIRELDMLGHEIGYHYEDLSDSNGDINLGIEKFRRNLEKLRSIAEINTISMHGRPLSKFDNRDMWKENYQQIILRDELGILGEVYLNIDYTDIAYVSDTGRNWSSDQSNLRDKVESSVHLNLKSKSDLLQYLTKPHKKMVFQIHPERWSDNQVEWAIQGSKDFSINIIKKVIKVIRGRTG